MRSGITGVKCLRSGGDTGKCPFSLQINILRPAAIAVCGKTKTAPPVENHREGRFLLGKGGERPCGFLPAAYAFRIRLSMPPARFVPRRWGPNL